MLEVVEAWLKAGYQAHTLYWTGFSFFWQSYARAIQDLVDEEERREIVGNSESVVLQFKQHS